jgi:hypothetical protein
MLRNIRVRYNISDSYIFIKGDIMLVFGHNFKLIGTVEYIKNHNEEDATFREANVLLYELLCNQELRISKRDNVYELYKYDGAKRVKYYKQFSTEAVENLCERGILNDKLLDQSGLSKFSDDFHSVYYDILKQLCWQKDSR